MTECAVHTDVGGAEVVEPHDVLGDTVQSRAKVRQALRAAQLYYLHDQTMESIAKELETSRSTISRLLTFAKASGLVDIQVRSPFRASERIAEHLRGKFNIRPYVVPVSGQATEGERLDRVAASAARVLEHYIDDDVVIGVAWGSTVSAVSRHLVPKPTHGSTVVQLNGAGNHHTTGVVYSSEILRRFENAYGCDVQQFPVPAFFDDASTKQALWRERSIQRILGIQRNMDVALFGLGSPSAEVPSRVYAGGYLDEVDDRELRRAGVAGDIATVFFRADGTSEGIALNQRTSGPDLDTIRKAGTRLCVVAGTAKVPSVRGALAANLVTDLIIDEGAAAALVRE